MEQSGGMATGSRERNELVRVRHGSDSGVCIFGFVSALLLHGTFHEDFVFMFFSSGSGNCVLSLCVIFRL